MSSLKPIAIIQTGHTYPQIRQHYGDFDDWIAQGLGQLSPVIRVDAIKEGPLPAPESLAGVVITGSHAMVTEAKPWMKKLAHWLFSTLENAQQLPVLGLCFGHQLLAQVLGGEVADNPLGMQVGTVPLRFTAAGQQDALLGAMAGHPWAQVVHRQSVLTPPPGSTVLASNVHDACQAFRYGERVWGVQFHPEFSADVMRSYLQRLSGEGLMQQQVDTHLQNVRECRDASAILARFAQLTLAQVA
ncbi:MAG: glutamine amidotransferase [Alcanivorax borkumensis]|jgi:GMP synthase (glutamine-hydrolysing)|uniref:Glutamine amidotransferase, class I (GATase) n=1 Tax=Alcanivorax borkumensis (strain ATCC 700651 / DSM 11573 / NCIMB 13689 / SK2) TaxID=393595 RepID=Q0VTG3_ALCBS|nr:MULTISPECIES: glutamine amidotransferase [Alcanivorax]OJH08824.1 MAG: glutamine amidotransferase [Alcanivorax borkumensis]EUC70726.1 glutamine amidotransferase [Alcanivorax sp. 97CO-5]PKG02245.1 GMP synthase [Alcanivorax sp. 97CO-6]CAL15499.1 glutamine amidotransferase, class I (GATase) [Alcanivorax borkumensis SK2]BAP12903.1 glutamine amidotransferase [Alcanivorax sp. NBRC 101098]